HEGSPFAGEIAEYFFTEICFKQIAAAYGDAEGDDAVFCFAGSVLEDGVAAVETTALEEHSSQGSTGAFWRHEEYVHVLGRNDARLFVKGDAEAMGEIQGFTGCKVFFHGRP